MMDFPKPEPSQKPWEWLRSIADQLEKEDDNSELNINLTVVNYYIDAYQLRSQHYGIPLPWKDDVYAK